jgi:hypothetical protein
VHSNGGFKPETEREIKAMTEDQIERQVERMMDHLDQVFLSSSMTQDEYDTKVKEINVWAENQYTVMQTLVRVRLRSLL